MLPYKEEVATYEQAGDQVHVSLTRVPEPAPDTRTQASENELFAIYERIAETRPGTRDAEIFAKIREWIYSDFALEPHEAAGISEDELDAWAERNRINLSAGHIRPDNVDMERGHAWGHIRRFNHINGIHAYIGPPSAGELLDMLSGFPLYRR
ncbi:MAG TPA: hypothetical protein VHY09_05150 [Candidatus Methylacidiphilales bacterium]|jgi:hypothetical protein|nr:hypothetical protein [Candidatus Methylacidiphilales bacterium]